LTDEPIVSEDLGALLASDVARAAEALIFASATPVSEAYIAERVPAGSTFPLS
jgi:chromosome segregation and condensation protein ScpB